MKYFFLFCIFIVGSCANVTDKKPITDSSSAHDSLNQSLLNKKDTFQIIAELVNSIRAKKHNGELTSKGSDAITDPIGGFVHGYYYNNTSIATLYSSIRSEYGQDQTEAFFHNNKIVYIVYRYLYFMPDSKQLETIVKAEKIFYFPETALAKDTVTVFNPAVKSGGKVSDEFQRDDFPTTSQTVDRIYKSKANLENRNTK
jgi:hypothetical protein